MNDPRIDFYKASEVAEGEMLMTKKVIRAYNGQQPLRLTNWLESEMS